MKLPALAAAAALALCSASSLAGTVGVFDRHQDVGDTAIAGKADFHEGVYTLSASGTNIWGTTDAFHYAYDEVMGDVALSADIAFEGQGVDPHRKAGVMLRQSLDAGSPYLDIMLHGDGLVSLQFRETQGGETHQVVANQTGARSVKLEYRNGYAWMSLAGQDGAVRYVGGGVRLPLSGTYLAGLALSSHNNTVSETAVFSRVELSRPVAMSAPTLLTPVESTLETLEISNKNRTIVWHTTGHIEAPNWSPDGSYLLYNSAGHLFTIPVSGPVNGGTPVKLETGALNKMNNDHGFSPDGKEIVVSDQTEPDNQSRIHILPAAGGTPRLVTPNGPSYWHGWSPDGKTLAYIAQRGGDYDVYSIPVGGGPETRLTTTPGLDDGAEYSADGQWIYFNSVRSGNMKLWRMKSDGSGAEQLTFGDDSRDWFPHPSPDGKWIAFIAFGTDVAVGDHPANKDVELRLMPAAGGEAVVLAWLFGGQGTINVPSWSPDSKKIAFVSYRPKE
ncbi:WD40-like Beta Propeller Repeat family protein [Asticcacaulis biprosthecium C19]|uniref:WD40-like Beta Propeller Repeat family protein n=1 Tax=Asticcacaulis biprosthecium C19 TaxID=715226 RepID=F4QHJ7_9CAUL|nr:TolB family protein [Asticcacaulis biprosthecium]EGF92734.1 WD40-like Beta Propeller Repeat family protein [Asticcacaulis biprosthecium C19]